MSKIIKQVFSTVFPKGKSVRMDGLKGDPTNILDAVYLNRVALMTAVPEGHVPTKVEISVKVLETAPEVA